VQLHCQCDEAIIVWYWNTFPVLEVCVYTAQFLVATVMKELEAVCRRPLTALFSDKRVNTSARIFIRKHLRSSSSRVFLHTTNVLDFRYILTIFLQARGQRIK
jgi:hypothetical protein